MIDPNDESGTFTAAAGDRAVALRRLRQRADAELLAAYHALPEDDQGPAAQAILAEIERRNLDI